MPPERRSPEDPELTQYAVEARYPGLAAVDEEKYLQAMDMAEQVCRWAETLVRATKGGR